jgi:hypothetical protein
LSCWSTLKCSGLVGNHNLYFPIPSNASARSRALVTRDNDGSNGDLVIVTIGSTPFAIMFMQLLNNGNHFEFIPYAYILQQNSCQCSRNLLTFKLLLSTNKFLLHYFGQLSLFKSRNIWYNSNYHFWSQLNQIIRSVFGSHDNYFKVVIVSANCNS